MTKAAIKTEDYRDITPYWISRLISSDIKLSFEQINKGLLDLSNAYSHDYVFNVHGFWFKKFTNNTMTLGYPKSGDTERIIQFEHSGIEIRTGNPEWGAEPNKLYFVIKHGKQLKQKEDKQ